MFGAPEAAFLIRGLQAGPSRPHSLWAQCPPHLLPTQRSKEFEEGADCKFPPHNPEKSISSLIPEKCAGKGKASY